MGRKKRFKIKKIQNVMTELTKEGKGAEKKIVISSQKATSAALRPGIFQRVYCAGRRNHLHSYITRMTRIERIIVLNPSSPSLDEAQKEG